MIESAPSMVVRHVRRSASERAPSLLRLRQHVIHVAFNNRVDASEKRIDGGRLRKHSGRLVGRSLLLPAGSELWGWTVGEVDFLRLELHPEVVRVAGEEAGRPGGSAALRPQVQLDDPVLWHLACVLRADMAMGCPGGQVLRDGVQGLIAHHLASAHAASAQPDPPPGPLSPARLRAVREFVRANLHRGLRLAEIASAAGVSTFHFARAFKATVGVPPYRYVLEERLVAACRLLEATDLPVGEVARLTGFQTLTGFGASFRQRWGVPPSQYRRSVRMIVL